jgi:glucokinase
MRLGLDVGGSFLKIAGLVDGQVHDLGRTPLPSSGTLEMVAEEAERLVREHRASAVGVGLAGLVRWPDGRFVWGPHLRGADVPFRSILERRLGLPVVVDNDANLAALAEATLGAGRGRRVVLGVMIGTGIGAGLVVDGAIFRGAGFAGEVGHMTMVEDGAACACGMRGCWETVVSGSLLDRAAGQILGSHAGSRELVAAAESGDWQARAALKAAGRWLGTGVGNLVLMLDPEVVVIGGAVSAAGDWLLEPARRWITSNMSGTGHRPSVPLVASEFGVLAGAVGAALATEAYPMSENDG